MRRNTVKRLQSESGLNYLTDTLTSAWDAMRANFGVSQKSAAPHGWLTRHRWPFARPNILIFILACIFADPYCDSTFPESAAVHHPFYPFSSVSARIVGQRRDHFGNLAGGAQRGHTGGSMSQLPIIRSMCRSLGFHQKVQITKRCAKMCKFQEEKEEICAEATNRGGECV